MGSYFKKLDIYHETNFIPMPFNGPTVLTVFDLSFHRMPETHPLERINMLENYFYPRISMVTHFITPSYFTKNEMIEHLGIQPDKITVCHLGVGNHFRPITEQETKSIISIYGLKCYSYILYTGTLEPRKNISNILRSYALLPGTLREKIPLVLVGYKGWLMENLEKEIRSLDIQSTTIITGYVPKEHLVALYSGAIIFIYPSLYEGFGLPPLEAMACGCPVLVSNVTSLPEVCGDAAYYVDPNSVEKMADGIHEVLTDDDLRKSLVRKGLEREKLFNWERTAKEHLRVFKEVLNS
jgi:alpha-1,3-rhamnosyl/mannosyltransferase